MSSLYHTFVPLQPTAYHDALRGDIYTTPFVNTLESPSHTSFSPHYSYHTDLCILLSTYSPFLSEEQRCCGLCLFSYRIQSQPVPSATLHSATRRFGSHYPPWCRAPDQPYYQRPVGALTYVGSHYPSQESLVKWTSALLAHKIPYSHPGLSPRLCLSFQATTVESDIDGLSTASLRSCMPRNTVPFSMHT